MDWSAKLGLLMMRISRSVELEVRSAAFSLRLAGLVKYSAPALDVL